MQVNKQQSELGMEQQTGSKSGKDHVKDVYCLPAYLTLNPEKCWARWIKIARWPINKLRYTNDTNLKTESEEELNSLLMKLKEESEKVGLKLSIQKTKIMASGPITSWKIDRDTVETVIDFILSASKSLRC